MTDFNTSKTKENLLKAFAGEIDIHFLHPLLKKKDILFYKIYLTILQIKKKLMLNNSWIN